MRPLPLVVAAAAAASLVVPAILSASGASDSLVAGAPPPVAKLKLDGASQAVAYRAAGFSAGGPPQLGYSGAEITRSGSYLVVQDGKVVAIAKREELPDMMPIVDFGAAKIMPGLVAADSTLTGVGGQGDHSLGAHRRAFDDFDPYDDMGDALARGITTVYLSPDRDRLVGGRGAVVKTAGAERVLAELADLRIDLTSAALNPPDFFRPPIPPTSENPLVTSVPQPPTSRAGAMLALRELAAAARDGADLPTAAFLDYLAGKGRLRIACDTTAEALSALTLAREWAKPVTLEGLRAADLEKVRAAVGDLDVAAIVEVPLFLSATGLPDDWSVQEGADVLAFSKAVPTTLKVSDQGDWTWLAEASASLGAGQVASLGWNAARALGLTDRVGHLAAGTDADFVVYSGDASAPAVEQVYIGGELVWKHGDGVTSREPAAEASAAVVVRGGTLWTGDAPPLTGGVEVLLKDGRVVAAGRTVARPAGARVVDAGADAHLTPGFIDARGYLGAGRNNNLDPRADLSGLAVGSLFRTEWQEVARAGVTTMVVGPAGFAPQGSRASVLKTAVAPDAEGLRDRDVVFFDLRVDDPALGAEELEGQLKRGKEYADKWAKYREERAKYEQEKSGKDGSARAEREKELRIRLAQGSAPAKPKKKAEEDKPDKPQEEVVEEVDPINGLWEATITHEMLPTPITVHMRLAHDGEKLTALLSSPDDPSGETVELEGTFRDNRIHVEMETEIGVATLDGEIVAPNEMSCTLALAGFGSADFTATRTQVGAAAAKIVKRRRAKDDGPQPPPIDWRMEGMRSLYEGNGVAVVAAERASDIRLALQVFAAAELPVLILGGDEADQVADELRAADSGVIVGPRLVVREEGREVVPAARLRAAGVRTAFQSDSEDGARTLPQALAMATRYGLGAEQVLRSLTADAADLLGVADRIGRLEPGKDGDLVVLSGPPFALGTRVLHVFVGGLEVPQE